jgi:tripartite-type tricarboxylate transporter receptor subunit TctC
MQRRQLLTAALVASLGCSASRADTAPIHILVGFPAGGSADVVARVLADKLKDELKRPVLVENKPGAGGRLAAESLKNAVPDGNTLMLAPIVVPVLAPMLFNKLPYNPATDFAPVLHAASFHFGLAVPGDAPYKTLAEFTAWLKGNPSKANFGNSGAGSLPHFFGLMIGREAGVEMLPVPFQGGAPLITALAGGQVSCAIDVLSEQLELHRSGKIRVLATSGAQRDKALPDIPSFRELGYPSIQAQSWYALYAPARTPAAAIATINSAGNKVLQANDVLERLAKLSMEPGGGTPADLQKLQDAEVTRWSPVVKTSGFHAD